MRRRREALLQDVLQMFWRRDLGGDAHTRAFADFLGVPEADLTDQDIEEVMDEDGPGAICFLEWLAYDHVLGNGRGLFGELLHRKGRSLGTVATTYLRAAAGIATSLYLAEAVRPGEGLTLRDIFRGGKVDVVERSGSRTLRVGHVIAVRIEDLLGPAIIRGSVLAFSVSEGPQVLSLLEENFEAYLEDQGVAAESGGRDPALRTRFLKSNGAWFYRIRRDFDASRPTLATTDGEELRSCRARYDVADRAAVAAVLDGLTDLDGDDGAHWVWLGGQASSLGRTIRGSIALEGYALTLECLSTERLAAGKALLEEACGSLLLHRMDVEGDLWSDSDRGSLAPGPGPEEPLPPEILDALRARIRGHYMAWLDEPIPALAGATPRAAARDPARVDQVRVLLSGLEGIDLGGVGFDPSFLWAEVGLERP